MSALLRVTDLGRMRYRDALERQRSTHARVLADRGQRDPAGSSQWTEGDSPAGELLLVEHDPPVVTLGRRSSSRDHLIVSPEHLAALGVELEESDRGGDITWHGPGQLVAYPILDLERLGLRIHPYMRLLEGVVIDLLAAFGVTGSRDPEATGVWVNGRKICAMGVRVSRWVSMHGLALNVDPDLTQFNMIVPCGLHGRPVTSLRNELGDKAPSMDVVRRELASKLESQLRGWITRREDSVPS